MPTGDHQSYPPLLPTQNVFTNNEILISPLQIERLDSQLEANILEEGREASTIQHDENSITQGEVEACVINEAQVEVPAENLVEELVEVETAAEVEEQVRIPNVTNTENISISVTFPVEVICEGVVTSQDETLMKTNLDESQHGNATNVPTVTQSHEMNVTENLSNTLEDTNENLYENLIDAQGEESSHLALGTFIPVESNVGRGKGKGIFRFLGFASKDPRPKFGAIQYFSDDRIAPYTMEDVPAIMRKYAEGDQILWIAKKNQELKKGKSPTNSNMNMLKEIEQYASHKGEYLSDGRSFEECFRWFVLGVLPGNNVTEAYSYYITGQVYDEYFVYKYVEDFKKLREHINKMLEKRSMEKSRT
nr:protein FAR1-RELATED SEQUENCE 5-like [Ipomoea batatas]